MAKNTTKKANETKNTNAKKGNGTMKKEMIWVATDENIRVQIEAEKVAEDFAVVKDGKEWVLYYLPIGRPCNTYGTKAESLKEVDVLRKAISMIADEFTDVMDLPTVIEKPKKKAVKTKKTEKVAPKEEKKEVKKTTKKASKKSSNGGQKDPDLVYKIIRDKMLNGEYIKNGLPWNQPWVGLGRAFNRRGHRFYDLLNCLLLRAQAVEKGLNEDELHFEFGTFDYWTKEMGGRIKEGEATNYFIVDKWWVKKRAVLDENGKAVVDDDGEPIVKTTASLGYVRVYEISQVEGVEPTAEADLPNIYIPENDLEKTIKDYFKREGIKFEQKKNNEAYYSPKLDKVVLPTKRQFKDAVRYFSTLAHEAVHSTGAKSRLNRDDMESMVAFGDESYSKEELTAEIGANYLLGIFGLHDDMAERNTQAYINSWLRALEDKPRMLVNACQRAEKAVNFILGR